MIDWLRYLQWRQESSSAVEIRAWDKPEASTGVDRVRSAGGGDREAAGSEERDHEGLWGVSQEWRRLAWVRTTHGNVLPTECGNFDNSAVNKFIHIREI